jgi:hypothetical protein
MYLSRVLAALDAAASEQVLYYSAVFFLVGLVVGLIMRFFLPDRG